MKEGLTKDNIKLLYEKNESLSVMGQYVMYDVYDVNNVPLGQRIGVRDLAVFDFKELFDGNGLIKDMREEYKKRKPVKPEKVVKVKKEPEKTTNYQPTENNLDQSNPPTESGIPSKESKKKSKPAESYSTTNDGYIESQISIRLHLKGKRRISVEQVIDLLKSKWEVDGYDIKMDKVELPEINEVVETTKVEEE